MSRYVDIGSLATELLESVRADSTQKTAAVTQPPRTQVAAAQELKKLAEELRADDSDEDVSDEDLAMLMQDQEVQELLEALENDPELLQALLEQADSGESEAEPALSQGMPQDMPAEAPEAPAEKDPTQAPIKTSAELRKVANYLRTNEKRFKHLRLVKAAQMLNTAKAIKHLTGGAS